MYNYVKIFEYLVAYSPAAAAEVNDKTCVCEISDAMGIPQPTMSNHLKVLETAGLVGSVKVCTKCYQYIRSDAAKKLLQSSIHYVDRANKKPMKIMILVGSADENSHSLLLGQAIRSELQALNQEVELINLVEYGLPLYNRTIERQNAYDATTREFLDKSLQMDAFVWVTPIYHNSYSAMLKNALDWHHSTKFPGKVVGIASNGGSRSQQAADQLTLVARSQHMLSIPTRICTDENEDYDATLTITSQDIKERIKKFAAELVEVAHKMKAD